MRAKVYLLLLFLLPLSACVSGEIDVEFNQVVLPHYSDIGRLTVSLEGEFDDKIKEEIVDNLKTCPLYGDVRIVEKPFKIGTTALAEAFDQQLAKIGRSSGGLLRLRMEHVEISEESEKVQSFLLFDQPNYDWYQAFGVPRLGTMGFADSMEIAPEVKKRRRAPLVKTLRIQQVYRMSLYNKGIGKIVIDRVGKNISAFEVFSKDPPFKKSQFEGLVRASLLHDIGFYSCPPSTPVVRHIYPSTANSVTARTITEGVAAAREGNWKEASSKWNEVLGNDPKNTLAQHNIGVYYERNGDLLEALKHYRLGFRDKRILEDSFGDIVGGYLPQDQAMESQIVQVTGGNWVFVEVPPGEKRSQASVYRATPIIDPDSSRIIGQTLKEIATLRVVSSQETRQVARIREYLLDSPVRVGDIVVFSDAVPSRAP